MSAEIIQFVPRRVRDLASHESSSIFAVARPDELAMDHADTAPCEYAPPPSKVRPRHDRRNDMPSRSKIHMPKAVTEIRSLARAIPAPRSTCSSP